MALFRVPKIEYDVGPKILEFGYPLDAAVAWREPVEGSQFAAAPSGARDAWIVREEPRLAGSVRWIPTTVIASPPFTGWDDVDGWNDFLTFARAMNSFDFFPDRTLGTKITSHLVAPLSGEIPLEPDGTRNMRLIIASADATTYDGY